MKYQEQNTHQTLKEGLDEYYASFNNVFDPETTSTPKAKDLFLKHDAVHVVFATDTSLVGETMTDTWTIFGTTIKFREALQYNQIDEIKQIVKETGAFHMLGGVLKAIPSVLRVIWRTRSMKKKWDWNNWKQHIDRPLSEIRKEFNIRVI